MLICKGRSLHRETDLNFIYETENPNFPQVSCFISALLPNSQNFVVYAGKQLIYEPANCYIQLVLNFITTLADPANSAPPNNQ